MEMLKRLALRYHLVLKRGQNAQILLTLLVNGVLCAKLKLIKWIKGIHRPIIHYYAVCWNEEAMLPWVFDYYGRFVDKFTIYDNYSTDGTASIVASNPKASLVKFGKEGVFDDNANMEVKNQCWKQSRGKADLVVVCDMDEFLYHNNLQYVLQEICTQRISFPKTEGYEMYSEARPEYTGRHLLTECVTTGQRSAWFDKHIIFDPHRIVDTHFDPGAHNADPTGLVNRGESDTRLKLLHYKYLGLENVLARHNQFRERLSSYNLNNELGMHYYITNQEKIEKQYTAGLRGAEKIVD